MRAMLRYIPLLLLAGLFWACGGDRALQSALDRADALMESYPDSALALLKPYDGVQIRSEAQRARFALLYSMALDKNGIDTANYKVIQPALDYYPTHGTDADKIRTLYYAGCIYQNAKRVDKAMEVWAEGLKYRGPKTDSLVLARLLVNQGNEYYRLYQFDKFKENQHQAEEIYQALGKQDLADKAFLYQFELALNRNSKFAKRNIGRVEGIALDSLSPNAELARSNVIQYEIHFGTPESLDARLKEYKGLQMDSIVLTQALLNLGRICEAEEFFMTIRPGRATEINYLLKKMRLEKAKGNFEEALACSENVLKIFDQKQSAVIEGDIQFAEERSLWRHSVAEHKRSEENAWIFSSIAIVVVLLISGLLAQRARIRNLQKEKLIDSLISEKEQLQENLDKLSSPELRQAIFRRLKSLDPISSEKQKNCTGTDLKKMLEERRQFMRDTRIALTASYPNFIEELKSHGLDDEELDYACLYAIGMRGKEIGVFMMRAGHYHLSTRVRAKLGLEKTDQRIWSVIQNMLKESGDF